MNNSCKVTKSYICKANHTCLVPLTCDISKLTTEYIMFEPLVPFPNGCLIGKSVHVRGPTIYCNIINATDVDINIPELSELGSVFNCGISPSNEKTAECAPDNLGPMKFNDIIGIKLGNNLSPSQKGVMRALLYRFHDTFQFSEATGVTHMAEHKIDTGDSPPIAQKQYPIPQAARDSMLDQVKDMLEKKVIRESNGPWRSPILLIRKVTDDGTVSYRFCIDLRKVNTVTVKDAYSLPRIDQTVDALSGSQLFSTMDIDRAFWQIPLEENSKQKTGFMVDGQLFEINVMPFGACNASATFQRLMDKVLKGMTWRQCLVYIDDVLVFAKDFDTHMKNLEETLDRIRESGLKLKPSKCSFGNNVVNYLGFTISDKGLQPSTKKIEALLKAELPKTTRVLNSFLCSINYYRHEIPDFGSLTADLYEMAVLKRRFCVWTDKAKGHFTKLILCLSKAPILMFPDFKKQFIIQADASDKSIGGVLLQAHWDPLTNKTVLKPVMFFGRKLSKIERRYSTTERELLALVYGYRQCFHLVYGQCIDFCTDHEPLVKLAQLKEPFGRLGRLFHHLVDVNYTIRYIPGNLNYLADFMSHCNDSGDETPGTEHLKINLIEVGSNVDWSKEQSNDVEISNVIYCIKNNVSDKGWVEKCGRKWLNERNDLYIYKGLLKHSAARVVVPDNLKQLVLHWHHDAPFAGHRGFDTVMYALKSRYFWLRLSSDVKEHCQSCAKCQIFNYSTLHSRAPLKSIEVVRSNQMIGIDYMGPFKTTSAGNRYIILGIDANDKFLCGAATKHIDAPTSAQFLVNEWVCKHGMVEQILTDQGQCFEASLFKHVSILLGSDKIRSSANHAQGNGITERVNKVIKPLLAKFVNECHDDWDLYLQMAINSYNTSYHSSIGLTPFELHFGRPSFTVADAVLNNKLPSDTDPRAIQEYTLNFHRNAEYLRKLALNNKQKAQEKQKLYYDLFVKNARKYFVGDRVKIANSVVRPGLSKAFERKFYGPYVITKLLQNELFVLECPSGLFKSPITVHYNRLEPFYERDQNLPSYLGGFPTVNFNAWAISVMKSVNVNRLEFGYFPRLKKKVGARGQDEAIELIETIPIPISYVTDTIREEIVSATNNVINEGTIPLVNNVVDQDSILDLASNLNIDIVNENVQVLEPLVNANTADDSVYTDADTTVRETVPLISPIQLNIKGKPTLRCLKCNDTKRFEAKTGLRIHQLTCVGVDSPIPTGFNRRKEKLSDRNTGTTSLRNLAFHF